VKPYLIVFSIALVVTYVSTPLVRRLAARVGAIDIPNDRKVHSEPTPRMGGLAMYLALLVSTAVAWAMPAFRELFTNSTELFGVLGGATIVVIVGVLDDMRSMRPETKLAGQLLAAGVLVLGGIQIFYFWVPGVGVLSLSSDLSALITVLWTVLLTNSINFADGLDGLAIGLTTIASITFFIYAYASATDGATTALLLTAIVAGMGFGFVRHNFNPARIFMGDSGSYMLGLLLASATVSGISRTTEPQFIDVAGFFIPVLIPVLVLAIPLADAGMAVLRRVRGKQVVFHPDKQHIHHWLLGMARSHRQAVLVMYMWSAMIAAATLVLALGPGTTWRIVSLGIVFVLVVSILAIPRMMRRGRPVPEADPPAQTGSLVGDPMR
jgi:UDP-GlcNAc:undecaprenyl-phosphate GlcNAc-1-phosphate transferase